MKIVVVNENWYTGGLDTFIYTLLNAWPRPEDELVLFGNASHPGLSVIEQRLHRSCRVVRYATWRYPDLVLSLDRYPLLAFVRKSFAPLLRYGFFLHYLRVFRNIFQRERADALIVVNGGYPGGDVCRAASIAWRQCCPATPSIHSFHNLTSPMRWYEHLPERYIDHCVARSSSQLVTVSHASATSLTMRPIMLRRAAVRVIYNGIAPPRPVSEQEIVALRRELGMRGDAPLCLMWGTYEPRKGHAFLFEAFKDVVARIPQARLVVAGFSSTEDQARVRRLCITAGLEECVQFLGFRSDIPALLALSHVAVIPSQAYESFGLVAVEAMAARVPIVSTNVGGLAEVVRPGEGGFIVAPDDLDSFARYIVMLLQDPALRRTQGALGFARYRSLFTSERMAQEYAQLLTASA